MLDPELPLPSYAHDGDAGLDLMATRPTVIRASGGRSAVRTGVAVAIQDDHVGLIVPRSGLAASSGVTVLNAPGVIDSGYRGEIVVLMTNLDPIAEYQVERGDRIAQLLIVPVRRARIFQVDELPASARGESGLGASGR